MSRFSYLLFSPAKGKILPQIICVIIVSVSTFVLLITLGGINSYFSSIKAFHKPICDSVIWSNSNINYWGLNDAIEPDDVESLIKWQCEEYENIEEISGIVWFDCNYGYFDSAENSMMIVRNNDYFEMYNEELFHEYLSESQNKAVLSSEYEGTYDIGDTIQLQVFNAISDTCEYVSLTVEIVDFYDCYLMNGASISPQVVDIITSEFLYDRNGNLIVSPKGFQVTSCIFIKDGCDLHEALKKIRLSSIAPHQLWISEEREGLYRESVFDPILLLLALCCFCFTFVFIVIFTKNILFLNYRKREIAIQCICGATFKECIVFSVCFEFILVILGFLSGLKWYIESYRKVAFIEPLSLDFSMNIVFTAFLILMITTVISALFATSTIKSGNYRMWLCKE